MGRTVEYIKHRLIGTPLEGPLVALRGLRGGSQRRRHPELRHVFAEGGLIDRVLVATLRPDSNAIDVGAHLGSMLSRMRALAPRGSHIAVEAAPYKAAWLTARYRGVRVIQAALGDREGEVEFHLDLDSPGESSINDNNLGHRVERVRVPLRRLDDLVPREHRVDFIKVDVEGAELDVLRGAAGLLRASRPVVLFESTKSCMERFGRTPGETFEFLASIGYGVRYLDGHLAGGPVLTAEEFSRAHEYPFRAFNFVASPT